jgi:hypothetical protein
VSEYLAAAHLYDLDKLVQGIGGCLQNYISVENVLRLEQELFDYVALD